MFLITLNETSLIVLLLGLTLLVGFGSNLLFLRFRIPDVLWLVVLGLLVGPVLHLISPAKMLVVAPILGAAALVLILFDAGLDMRLDIIRPLASSGIAFAALSYFCSTAVLSVISYFFVTAHDATLAVVFGAALGCTSGAVVIPIATRLRLPPNQRSLIHLVGALEDTLAIVAVTVLILILTAPSNAFSVPLAVGVILPLPVGVAVGLGAGFLWLQFLTFYQRLPFAALATLGFVFVVYAVTQALGGSGILASLVLGGVLANSAQFRRYTPWVRGFQISRELRSIEAEIAFLLRSFFLFLIGLVVASFSALTVPLAVGLAAGALVILWIRYTFTRPLKAITEPRPNPRGILATMYGRGLTSAVLLTVPLAVLPRASTLFLPALVLIMGTNIIMTIGVLLLTRQYRPSEGTEEAETPPQLPVFVAFSPEMADTNESRIVWDREER
jgi:cell volume regulation protein A